MRIEIETLTEFPEVSSGDDIVGLIVESSQANGIRYRDGDILVIAQKIISKAEGRLVNLPDITPSWQADILADETNKDPRLVELILSETDYVVRQQRNILIVAHKLGLVHANAGIDQSNIAGNDHALLLPIAPDESAARIRAGLEEIYAVRLGIIIADSVGRAWRLGTVGIAIGASGAEVFQDLKGHPDRYGRDLAATEVGMGDQLAAAASLIMGQAAEGTPVALIRGLDLFSDEQKASDLLRPAAEDLFR